VSRTRKALVGVGSLVALLLMATIAGVIVLRSDWFREKVRERIVFEAEKAINGSVELGRFTFDWKTLTAELDDLTIHGTEAPGQAPLLAVKRLLVGLKIISLAERTFNIASLEADAPRAHLIVQPDGDINIPPPRKFKPQMILDLKIGRLNIRDGALLAEAMGQKPTTTLWNARGENVTAKANYDPAKARYSADVSLSPMHFQWAGYGALDARVAATATMEKNRFTIPRATVTTLAKNPSGIELTNVVVTGFTAPVVTANYAASLALDEVDRVFRLVDFQHTGTIGVKGNARFVSMRDYFATGSFEGSGIGYGKVSGLRTAGTFDADQTSVRLHNARVSALNGEILANGEVKNFSTFNVTGKLQHFDGAQLISLTGMAALPYDGVISGPFQATGTLSERNYHGLTASATLSIEPAQTGLPVHGELTGKFDGTGETVDFAKSWIGLPGSRVDFSGIPGQRLDVKLESNDLNEFRPLVTLPAALRSGAVSFAGSVSGALNDPRIAGHATIRNVVFEDQKIDSLAGDFTAANSGVTATSAVVSSNGLQAQGSGSLGLTRWNPTDGSAIVANVHIVNGDLTKLLALAGRKDEPVTGTLNTTAQIAGTVADPHVSADLTLVKGEFYGEPFDTVTGHAQYVNGGAETLTAAFTAGAKHLNLSLQLSGGQLNAGKVTFNISSNVIALNQLATVHRREPDLQGLAQIKADGTLEFHESPAHKPQFTILDLNGEATATSLALGTRNFGDANLSATTRNGILTARLTSNAVKAAISGEGTIRLAGDYPVDAKVTFSEVRLNAVEAMLNPSVTEHEELLDGAIAGQLTLSGPAKNPDLITAAVELNQIELRPAPHPGQPANLQTLVLRNDGPVRMTLAHSIVNIENARLQGPETNLQFGGSVALNQQSPLDLTVRGNINLALAHTLNEDLASSGEMVVNANIRGTFANPDLTGRAELQKGDFRYAGFVNGLTNANGVLLFSGTRATIQSLTAESGGGKVDATGFVTLTAGSLGTLAFRLETHARGVRIRYPEGVSSLSDADLTVAGTSDRSEASGRVTIRRILINPTADAASILATSAEPAHLPSSRTGLAANMNLDVQIDTAPDVSFETSVAQSLEADASLRLRGTATSPALLGRINVTQGEMKFFGNRYTISQGSISFLNPSKIDPILNVSVETKARGVAVTLTISGPANKLNVSYRSDPPLQFGDIVALLATGRAPTNATLESAGTGQLQNFQQLGASALLGQALANPTAPGRLQRFFGVSNIKLNPELSGITGSPETRLSIEQQVAPNILFTYDASVADASTQLIRVELDFNPRWAAILTREENGYVALDFAYKRRFK
jgi:translocation and assembly module TamB